MKKYYFILKIKVPTPTPAMFVIAISLSLCVKNQLLVEADNYSNIVEFEFRQFKFIIKQTTIHYDRRKIT